MIKVGIVGASGNTGKNLIHLLKNRNDVEIVNVVSTTNIGEIEPLTNLKYIDLKYNELNKLDLIYLAVPHGSARDIAKNITTRIIDMSSDHRITETYGLPEINRDNIAKARIIGNPGCYATACILSVYPIKEYIEYVVFDCISGYSGAGKKAKELFDYEENIIAYKLTNHFHIQEIEKYTELKISFTPHIVNSYAGLMSTAHIFVKKDISTIELKNIFRDFYKGTLTKVVDTIPCTKDVFQSSYCHIGGFEKDKNNQLVLVSAIDNLHKGAASQAIENMDIMFSR